MIRSHIIAAMLMALPCVAREWTSADGRKVDADFVAATADQVTLRRAGDGRIFTLPLARLSPADQAFIKGQNPTAEAAFKPVSGPFAALLTGDWALSEYKGLPFALYGASDLSAAKSYPLILALHGRSETNENGKQVGGWMKSFTTQERYTKNPCIILAPLGYQPYGGEGRAWVDKPGQQTLVLLKELMKSLPVDESRVYCTGYSMGGFGTCLFVEREPRLFAAAVAVAGCTDARTAPAFRRMPVWFFHAADDTTVPVSRSRDLVKAIGRAKDCHYTEYPGGGHSISGKAFEEPALHEWLFSRRRN
jgi:predicted peptidase